MAFFWTSMTSRDEIENLLYGIEGLPCVMIDGSNTPRRVRLEELDTDSRGVQGVIIWDEASPRPEPWANKLFVSYEDLYVEPRYWQVRSTNVQFVFDPIVCILVREGSYDWRKGYFERTGFFERNREAFVERVGDEFELLATPFRAVGAGVRIISDSEARPFVHSVHAWNRRVTDELAARLPAFPKASALVLSATPITDAALPHLLGLRQLEMLDLECTAITDTGLTHLAAMPWLKHLHVNLTRVTEAGVEALQKQLPNCEIWSDWSE